jgi:putrescine transport system ATP-binding protein
VTFVVVTHDQEEAMTMSCRVAIMNQGEILQVDTPHAMYEYPNTRYVTEFFGSVNMFEGILVEDEADHVVIECPDLVKPIYVSHGVSGREGGTVFAAIRPEKATLSKTPPTDTGYNCCEGKVEDIVYLGGESTYLVKLDSGRVVRVGVQNLYRASEPDITWEDRVWISWQPGNVVVVSS